jgi:ATP-dependent Clp protease ATP-binding subunit ClpA
MFSLFSQNAKRALVCATDEVIRYRHKFLKVTHLFLGVLQSRDPQTFAALKKNRISPAELETAIRQSIRPGSTSYPAPSLEARIVIPFANETVTILRTAGKVFDLSGERKLTTGHILQAILQIEPKRLVRIISRCRTQ